MSEFELIVPCHFGMESVLKKEIYDIGYEITDVSDGRVTFLGDEEAVARANIFLRTGAFPIEAALIAANIAPGVNRTFTAQAWKHLVPASGSPKRRASRASSSLPPTSSLS